MTWRWRRIRRQSPAATAADAACAQGQVGLRQGRGLHLGHQHLFPREHARFQEKMKKTQFFCQVCYTMPEQLQAILVNTFPLRERDILFIALDIALHGNFED